jgi:hypothetical protein
LLAVSTYKGISFFSVEFDAEGKPTISKLFDYDLASQFARLKFDIAGNLHIFSRDNGGYKVLALANEAPVAFVDAPDSSVITAVTPQPAGAEKAYFPYDLAITNDEDNHVITFKSTGDAKTAVLVLTDANDNETRVELGAVEKGENSFQYNSSELPEGGVYNWAIELYGNPVNETAIVFEDASGLTVRGTALPINDTDSKSFGYTIVGHGGNNGFDIYNPAGEKVATRIYKDNALIGSINKYNQSAPEGAAEFDGKAVFSDWSDEGSELIVIDPVAAAAAVAANEELPALTTMLEGEKDSTGAHKVGDVATAGGSPCIAFHEIDGKTKAFMFEEDVLGNKLARYDISENKTINTAAEKVFDDASAVLPNHNVELAICDEGIFAAEVRSEGNVSASQASFIFVSHDGEVLYNNGDLEESDPNRLTSSASGIALSYDESLLAVSTYKGISFFSVEFDAEGKPTISKLFDYDLASQFARLKFDIAGNLHIFSRDNGGYKVLALKDEAPATSVAAPEGSVLLTRESGVKNISIDNAQDAAATYYNLNGVRVSANTLIPGVYIKVVGEKATKVIVK